MQCVIMALGVGAVTDEVLKFRKIIEIQSVNNTATTTRKERKLEIPITMNYPVISNFTVF